MMINSQSPAHQQLAAAAAAGQGRYRALAAARARIAADAWGDHPGRNMLGQLVIALPGGREATIGHLQADIPAGPDGVASVAVWTGPPDGPPQYRIVNPPLLVPDPAGPITLPARPGRPAGRYREDPLAAIAAAIAHGRSAR